jgi:hypothetical protein
MATPLVRRMPAPPRPAAAAAIPMACPAAGAAAAGAAARRVLRKARPPERGPGAALDWSAAGALPNTSACSCAVPRAWW